MEDKKAHIAFVSAVPGYDIFNRKSAIDSILCSLLLTLSEKYLITVNGQDFLELKKRHFTISEKPVTALSSTSFIKSLIPKRIKLWIKERRLMQEQNRMIVSLKQVIQKPDLVFELYKYNSLMGKSLSDHFKVPYLLYYDAPEVEQYYEIHRVKPLMGKKAWKNEKSSVQSAQAVVVYSQAVKDFLVKETGAGENNFFIYQTLDYTRLVFDLVNEENDVLNIGYIGSFMRWHKVERLVRVFEKLCAQQYNIKLLLVGAGEAYKDVKELVETGLCSEKIEMPGFVDGKTLDGYKRRLHIGIMPGSRWYNIPTKVFEYGAAGTASIAPRTPTIEYIFSERKDILLFDDEDEETVYTALKEMLDNKVLRKQLAVNLNTEMKQRFTAEKAAGFYEGLIKNLLR